MQVNSKYSGMNSLSPTIKSKLKETVCVNKKAGIYGVNKIT